MRKNLNTCVRIIGTDGSETMYADIEEAVKATGLTKRQLEMRAIKESSMKGVTVKWCDPSTKRSYIGRKARRKGNSWELEIINNLKKVGYAGCVSARSESKRIDDAKVDIVDIEGKLPCHIQAKATRNMPNYHKIAGECTMKDKPFVIACKLTDRSPIAVLPLDYFYELIKDE
jgi:hypothetical protein|uniref:HJC-DNA COMPLEX, HYDROLASE DNA COMPLEX n=1 Tax=Podoviridae sp. ctz6O13 TaxID=2827757 RepID=A0A8S5TLV7_9CAUD|nr:MAG TPA: HJC-DNA COMPLEX, HYDROLASE DNA COMPLEX [Podoviridae sp. ctz6O13]